MGGNYNELNKKLENLTDVECHNTSEVSQTTREQSELLTKQVKTISCQVDLLNAELTSKTATIDNQQKEINTWKHKYADKCNELANTALRQRTETESQLTTENQKLRTNIQTLDMNLANTTDQINEYHKRIQLLNEKVDNSAEVLTRTEDESHVFFIGTCHT